MASSILRKKLVVLIIDEEFVFRIKGRRASSYKKKTALENTWVGNAQQS